MIDRKIGLGRTLPACCFVLALAAFPAIAQDPNTCADVTCDTLADSVCDASGFTIELIEYVPAPPANSGSASYIYEICAPAADGTCEFDDTVACADHQDCANHGGGLCSGDCRVDKFQDLSHINIYFPELGGLDSCLSDTTAVTGSCSQGNFTLGDGSCAGQGSATVVAKCDETGLTVGECMTMTVTIPGELNRPGLGIAVTESKAPDCIQTCIAGPSCDDCGSGGGGDGEECLTRTRGFWGTHPHITELYLPVTVCDNAITQTPAGDCDSSSEALCTNARDLRRNPTYLTLVAQLTAAKINLNATAALVEGAACSDFVLDGESIGEIILRCEGLCDARKQVISESGCIEALNAFNQSEDVGFDATPEPFDRPGPAQPGECQEARGNGRAIGKGECEVDGNITMN